MPNKDFWQQYREFWGIGTEGLSPGMTIVSIIVAIIIIVCVIVPLVRRTPWN